MLDSLSDLGRPVPRLEAVPESHVIPHPPWACGDDEEISSGLPFPSSQVERGIPERMSPGPTRKMPLVCKSPSPPALPS